MSYGRRKYYSKSKKREGVSTINKEETIELISASRILTKLSSDSNIKEIFDFLMRSSTIGYQKISEELIKFQKRCLAKNFKKIPEDILLKEGLKILFNNNATPPKNLISILEFYSKERGFSKSEYFKFLKEHYLSNILEDLKIDEKEPSSNISIENVSDFINVDESIIVPENQEKQIILPEKQSDITEQFESFSFLNQNLENKFFENANLVEVLKSFIEKKDNLEDINITNEIKNPFFRFITKDNPYLSYLISEALTLAYKEGRKFPSEYSDNGPKTIIDEADEFAKKMFPIVRNLQEINNVKTVRDTVELLQKNDIPTARGGKWANQTYQDLKDRWKKLGLIP